MTRSMTGFASRGGTAGDWTFIWEIRAVNGRGLEVRLRLPDGFEMLEPAIRAAMKERIARGSITIGLRASRSVGPGGTALNAAVLGQVLDHLAGVTAAAAARGIPLGHPSSAEVLGLRGVLDQAASETPEKSVRHAVMEVFAATLEAFDADRAREGAALQALLSDQTADVARLVEAAFALAPERTAKMRDTLREAMARVLDNAEGAEPDRIAQELALMAVKADITEEIDRLRGHVSAAQDLLQADGPKGRKLDFLIQEFNREANTMVSKAQFAALTGIGLDLKHTIDQMREQVQNVE